MSSADLELSASTHLLPLPGASWSPAAEQLDVGAQAGERRAQLVAGVGDEALLLRRGRGERVDHGGEAAGQAADLAAPVGRDRRREVLGGRDLLGRVPQVDDRPHDAAGEPPAEERGRGDAGEREDQQPIAQRREHVVDLGEAARDLEDAAARATARQHPVSSPSIATVWKPVRRRVRPQVAVVDRQLGRPRCTA